jgi:hypothetical protein
MTCNHTSQGEKMRIFVLSTVAFTLLTTAATAEPATSTGTTGPVALTDEQMDRVTAGQALRFGSPPSTLITPGASDFVATDPIFPRGGFPAEVAVEPGLIAVNTSGAAGLVSPLAVD